MNKGVILFSIIIIMIATACTQYQYEPVNPTGEVVTNVGDLEVNIEDNAQNNEQVGDVINEEVLEDLDEVPEVEETTEEVEEIAEEEVVLEDQANVIVFEGDLVDLKPYVMDPDGDDVGLGFTVPFDQEGMWQTEVGDAGFYSIIVTATDNKDSFVTRQMTVNVLVRNKPPVINIADTLEFDEGDLVKINPDIYDEDGDEVVVIYSGWLDNTKTYQTTYDDAGTYVVTIRADDGKEIVSKDFNVIVHNFNRMPIFELLSKARIEATEGDLVEIKASAEDPDGDEVSLSYSEPFDQEGMWQTEKGDAGQYTIIVIATDGENEVSNEVLVELMKMNEVPEIKSLTVNPTEVVLKKPGDKVTIKINVVALDVDGDELEITYSGYMDSAEKTVSYGEKGGLKVVTVTVSDGKDSVSKDISFNMNNWPCFECQ